MTARPMKQNSSSISFLVAVALACLVVGCSKKTAETAPEATPAAVASPTPQSTPLANSAPPPAASPNAQLAESQAAISAGDYERAADTLLAARQAQLDAQQAEAVAAQMRQLQSSLASAIAGGDARAKAAAAKLRAAATVR